MVFFIAIGQLLSRQMMKKIGGGNSMMFGMSSSDAKVYVKSAEDIKFTDAASEDEAKRNRRKQEGLSRYLDEKETIAGEEFMAILNG